MNPVIRPPKRPKRPSRSGRPPRRGRIENEFLPAALEILETPASPIRTAFIWFIAVVVAATLAWSYLGTFDIVSTAQGKIQPTGRVKVIQSIEVGKVRSIPVINGSKVKAGDIVVQLDDTELRSDEEAIAINLQAYRAEMVRRRAVLATVEQWQAQGIWTSEKPIPNALLDLASDIPPSIREREQSSFKADLSQLAASLTNIAAQHQQAQATVARLQQTMAAQQRLVDTLNERVAIRATLVGQDAGSKAGVIDAKETSQKEEATLAEETGQLEEAKASLAVTSSDGEKTLRTFIADNVEKAGEASRQADELERQLVKARERRQSMTIVSPIDGTVQSSSINTVGQVVTTGVELMRIVPDNSTLEVEAYLPNSDIGFVSVGQTAVVKVEAFPFTRYGVIRGHVTAVAKDAIPEPDANQVEGDPTKQLQATVPTTNVQRVQNLVFPVTVELDAGTMSIDGHIVPLSPGMAATAEIKTGKRRILEYLFSPIVEVTSQAMQER
jgi:hemolysin D